MIVALAGLALAGPPPFEQVDQADSYDGCSIRIGRRDANGIALLRAECDWSDVSVDDLRRVLQRYDHYDEFIDCIDQIRIVRAEAGRALVWQLDRLGWGLADCESQTWMAELPLEGGFRIVWTTGEEAFEPRPGNIAANCNNGSWWITAAADGGVHVVEDLEIDPGGTLPAWVINWFQTYALRDELRRLHAVATAAAS